MTDERQLPIVGEVTETKAEPDDDVYYSVTTIIGTALDKPALIPWAVGETAERTVANLDIIRRRLEEEGAEEAVKYVERLRWQRAGLSDTELGTLVHHMLDLWATTRVRPDVVPELHPNHDKDGSVLTDDDLRTVAMMLDQADRGFLQAFAPDYQATEVVVYCPEYGYAGQCDGFVTIDGLRLILDYKTSRKTYDRNHKLRTPYPEVALQLAAYRYATHAAVWRARRYSNRSRRYYLLNATEKALALPVPEVDNGIAVYITPGACHAYPVRCDAGQYDAFLYALEVSRWVFNESQHVIGNPMIPTHEPPEQDPFRGLPTE